jgi:hypothetical protein
MCIIHPHHRMDVNDNLYSNSHPYCTTNTSSSSPSSPCAITTSTASLKHKSKAHILSHGDVTETPTRVPMQHAPKYMNINISTNISSCMRVDISRRLARLVCVCGVSLARTPIIPPVHLSRLRAPVQPPPDQARHPSVIAPSFARCSISIPLLGVWPTHAWDSGPYTDESRSLPSDFALTACGGARCGTRGSSCRWHTPRRSTLALLPSPGWRPRRRHGTRAHDPDLERGLCSGALQRGVWLCL